MSYKIETHMHTPYVSRCAKIPAEELVKRYKAAGYDAITVTDHYNLENFAWMGLDLDGTGDKLEAFLEGYHRVREIAEPEGIRVFYGAELRFFENQNDYLLYGFSPELLAEPRKVCAMSIVDFIRSARQDGALLFQAHPFRRHCVPIAPAFLDGMEIANRHPRHPSRNELAAEYVQQYGLLKIGGSDFHDDGTPCIGGIVSETLPEDTMQLAQLLRSGRFSVL